MTRWLKAFLCVTLVNLALSIAFVPVAVSAVREKGHPVMHQNRRAFSAGLARRADVRRRVERVHPKRAVVPAQPRQAPQQAFFAAPGRSIEAPVLAAAPPDHPPA